MVAAAFLFSGTVKLIDPRGTEYKLHDYAVAFQLHDWMPDMLPLTLAVLIAVVEFRIGFSTFFGIQRRFTSRLALLFMLVFTPLTLYLALYDPVTDCGCFGDALVLSNWMTFAKNIVLLMATIVLVRWSDKQTRLISEDRQWIVLLYAQLYGFGLAVYTLWTLPLIDFRPYKIGNNLLDEMASDTQYETLFLMEKDGRQETFTTENYPDSTWTFVDMQTRIIGEEKKPRIDNFQITMVKGGEDITDEVLTDTNYCFLLVAPSLTTADDGRMDAYNNIYEYACLHGYRFLCLTSSVEQDIHHWSDMTGAEYPFCHTDELTLKTMVRSNPGLVLLKGGVVYNKWPYSHMPELREDSPRLNELEIGQLQTESALYKTARMFFWFFIPLIVVTFLDRIWCGILALRDWRKRIKLIELRKKERVQSNENKV